MTRHTTDHERLNAARLSFPERLVLIVGRILVAVAFVGLGLCYERVLVERTTLVLADNSHRIRMRNPCLRYRCQIPARGPQTFDYGCPRSGLA